MNKYQAGDLHGTPGYLRLAAECKAAQVKKFLRGPLMSYRAKVIKIMIASPSDVAVERHVIRNVVQEWNFTHSQDKKLVLMPVGWESHAAPAMGDRPQAIINQQVLADCDLLIAVFWTKLGSPTGRTKSGTVEEIEEHIKAHKPAMIYFSSIPFQIDSVDKAQHKALGEFKKELGSKGLYAEYNSIEVFREMLSRQLAQNIIRHFAPRDYGADAEDDWTPGPKGPAFTDQARAVLIGGAQEQKGGRLLAGAWHAVSRA